MHIYLGQRRHQGLFPALVAFEQLGRVPAVLILGHAQLELSHPGDEGRGVVAGPSGRARALFGPGRVGISASSISASPRARVRAAPPGSSKVARRRRSLA
jgi:hypothetical protein